MRPLEDSRKVTRAPEEAKRFPGGKVNSLGDAMPLSPGSLEEQSRWAFHRSVVTLDQPSQLHRSEE